MNNSNTIGVRSVDELLSVKNNILEDKSRITTNLNKIKTAVDELSSYWDDKNAKTYLERFEELRTSFEPVSNSIENCAVFLNTVVNTYQTAYYDVLSKSVNSHDVVN